MTRKSPQALIVYVQVNNLTRKVNFLKQTKLKNPEKHFTPFP